MGSHEPHARFPLMVRESGTELEEEYLPEYPITQAWLDSRAQRIYAGSTEIMKDLIGRSMQLG